MPSSSSPLLVITAKNGYVRNNHSWVLDRIMRDYDGWADAAVKKRLNEMLDERHAYLQAKVGKDSAVPRPGQTGLCVSIYESSTEQVAGEPTRNLTYWSGLATVVIQLAIATISVVRLHDWGIMLVTIVGITLTFITGALPQWRDEKWPCRRGSHNTYILTRGNGAQHASIILGNGKGLNLEDMATDGQMQAPTSRLPTRICLATLSVLWVGLLIAAAGLRTNTWLLLAIGGIGMAQNVLVAGWRCDPSSLGMHLDFRGVIGEMAAMDTLLAVEASFPSAGTSLLPIFFPGKLLPHEVEQWDALDARTEEERARIQKEGRYAHCPKEGWNAHAKTCEKK